MEKNKAKVFFFPSTTKEAALAFKRKKIFTSVERGGVVNVCSYEGRFSLSANGVVPHPPDTTLKEISHTRSKLPLG